MIAALRELTVTDHLQQLHDNAGKVSLVVSAVALLTEQDGFDGHFNSIALLSPDPRTFWTAFTTSTEAQDGHSDPIDRWSRNRVTKIAAQVGGLAAFPFDGPPYLPFSAWARRAGTAWQSPSGLLVHAIHGLWISFRGAVALPSLADHPAAKGSPCETCPRPCLSACPVGAFTPDGFNYEACLGHVRSEAGRDCIDLGCRARRACPVGQEMAPPNAQLRDHMTAFVRGSGR